MTVYGSIEGDSRWKVTMLNNEAAHTVAADQYSVNGGALVFRLRNWPDDPVYALGPGAWRSIRQVEL